VRSLGRRTRGEEGSATAELAILTPLLILFLLLVVAFGRLAGARIQVDGAAAQAARAASIARSPATATAAAEQTASSALSSQHVTCAHLQVAVDTADFVPGGSVAVTVSCAVDLSTLTGLQLPVTETLSNRFVEPIDAYRSVSG
jgi:Flp pilus assembly protein TadG